MNPLPSMLREPSYSNRSGKSTGIPSPGDLWDPKALKSIPRPSASEPASSQHSEWVINTMKFLKLRTRPVDSTIGNRGIKRGKSHPGVRWASENHRRFLSRKGAAQVEVILRAGEPGREGSGMQGHLSERFCLYGAFPSELRKGLFNSCLCGKSGHLTIQHVGASVAEGKAQKNQQLTSPHSPRWPGPRRGHHISPGPVRRASWRWPVAKELWFRCSQNRDRRSRGTKEQLPFNHLNRYVRPKRLFSHCDLDKGEVDTSPQVILGFI